MELTNTSSKNAVHLKADIRNSWRYFSHKCRTEAWILFCFNIVYNSSFTNASKYCHCFNDINVFKWTCSVNPNT